MNLDRGLGYGVDTDFSPDGKWFAIGQDNRMVAVYNTKTWGLVHTFKPEDSWSGGCGPMLNLVQIVSSWQNCLIEEVWKSIVCLMGLLSNCIIRTLKNCLL